MESMPNSRCGQPWQAYPLRPPAPHPAHGPDAPPTNIIDERRDPSYTAPPGWRA